MLRYGLPYSVGLAVCAGAVCMAQPGGALAWSTSVSPASSPVLVVAAKDTNSSIAVSKITKTGPPAARTGKRADPAGPGKER